MNKTYRVSYIKNNKRMWQSYRDFDKAIAKALSLRSVGINAKVI